MTRVRVALLLLMLSAIGQSPARALSLQAGDILLTTFSQSSGPAVLRVDPATGQTDVVTSGGLLTAPEGLAIMPDGDLLVANQDNYHDVGSLVTIDPSTGAQRVFASGGLLSQPYDVALASNGDVFVADNHSIIRLDSTGSTQQTIYSYAPGFASVDVFSSTDLIVGHSYGAGAPGSLVDVNISSGKGKTLAVAKPFYGPDDLVVNPKDGSIYATAMASSSDITEVNPVTLSQRTVTSGVISTTFGIALAPDGSLVTTDGFGGLYRADPVTGAANLVASDPAFSTSFGVAVVAVPETSTLAILALGLVLIGPIARSRSTGPVRPPR